MPDSRGGAGRMVTIHRVCSPLGPLEVAVREGKLIALGFTSEMRDLAGEAAQRLPGVELTLEAVSDKPTSRLLDQTSRQLGLYFARRLRCFDLPLEPFGTSFQKQVWAELRRIPYGEARTYAEVGAALGSRRLARAVGSACGCNPLPIVIPCHRVVASNGGLGGFSGGLDVKRFLLAIEAQAQGES